MMKSIGLHINKALKQLRFPMLGIIARGSSKSLQVKGLQDETLQEIELIQQVGFNSHIPDSAKVIVIPLQGKTAKAVVVATTGGAVVVNVAEGETCVYDQFGHSVWLKEDGTHIEGDLFVNGEVKDKKGTMQEIRDQYNQHKHGSSPAPSPQM